MFPPGCTVLDEYPEGLFFHRIKVVEGVVTGYILQQHNGVSKVREQWSMSFPPDIELISDVATLNPHDIIQSSLRYIGDHAGVLHKYLNPHLIALATVRKVPASSRKTAVKRVSDPSVNIYLIDGVTGSIVERILHKNAEGPVHIIQSENVIVYHFWDVDMHQYHLSVLELYEARDDLATAKEWNQPNFSSFSALPPQAKHQTYVLRTGVKAIGVTSTKLGITNKEFLLALTNEQLLGVGRTFLDPRRPTGEPSKNDKEEGLLPYATEIPSTPTQLISYNRTIARISGIESSAAQLESSSLVFAYGLDMFFTRVMPSQTFDQLSPDFNYPFLVATVTAVIIGVPILKTLSDKQDLAHAWK